MRVMFFVFPVAFYLHIHYPYPSIVPPFIIHAYVHVHLFVSCTVSLLNRNVEKVNRMLHEMREIAVDKENTDSKRCFLPSLQDIC